MAITTKPLIHLICANKFVTTFLVRPWFLNIFLMFPCFPRSTLIYIYKGWTGFSSGNFSFNSLPNFSNIHFPPSLEFTLILVNLSRYIYGPRTEWPLRNDFKRVEVNTWRGVGWCSTACVTFTECYIKYILGCPIAPMTQ